MAEPDSIPALFKLSLTALIEHVKNKRLKISPDQIPPSIHSLLWENSTALELMNENNADFITSQLPHYKRSCLEVINWICKAFRCEISELDLGYENIKLSWPRLKFANSLKIRLFGKLEDLEQLIMERKKNNLRTTLDAIWIVTPLQIELLPFIDFSTAWIRFSNLKIDELIEQFRDLSTRAPCSVMAWTTNLSTEDFERFKAQLEFDNRSTTSALNRSRIKYKLGSVPGYQFAYIYNDPPNEKFYCFRDDKITLFRFMFSEPGVYNGIIMNVF
ncbi:hypothetical protein CAEBREN_26035 [Caenorhabditis brenneri]|uniref:DUF38 domain-containing protein n=1 Tax=Caenorhabditis brenneri TaxID=135651 RepID=G0MA89_CAEBE|nr:hypothetical protein CAEBREN_26035 [Caenorhabditis brenneri]